MKLNKLWMLAAILLCGIMTVTTACKGGKQQVSEANDSTATPDVEKMKEEIRAQYGENKNITGGNYDQSLAVKCINGTFVGKKNGHVITYKGIPFVGEQPVLARIAGRLQWPMLRKTASTRLITKPRAPIRLRPSAREPPFTTRAKTAST